MALNFNPPEWLIRDYLNRKQPAEIANEGIQQGLQTYATMKEKQGEQATRERQMKLLEQKQAMDGRENFYKYGDLSGLKPEEQSIFNPVQGPNNQVPADYQTAQQAQLGGAPGPALPMTQEVPPAEPRLSPVLQYFKDFHQAYPQGTAGQQFTEDTILQTDDKGNTIGSSTVKRPIKGKTLMTRPGYQATRGVTPQQTQFTDPNGNPLQFTPVKGYEVAPVAGGVKPVLRKGDESSVTDANTMLTQMDNIDKVFDAYKNKSMLGAAAQATPLGGMLDPETKQMEDSLKLTAFTFGGKNLTGQEKEVVFGAFFATPFDARKPQVYENKRKILKDLFAGRIDLMQAGNLLGPAGAPIKKMLDQKMKGGSGVSQGGGGLSPAEQAELDALEKEFGGKP